jgi:hypothetical protein
MRNHIYYWRLSVGSSVILQLALSEQVKSKEVSIVDIRSVYTKT